MNRRDFVKLSAQCLAASAMLRDSSEVFGTIRSGRKPNIVLIVADDLGYGETSIQGSRDIQTPNIDSIAKNGTRFTDGYVSCPVCSPTRAGLMTGRYQQRFGHEFNPGPDAGTEAGLPLTETTLPQRLKSLGYSTGMFGKWHLGNTPEKHPMKRGFDEFYGFLGGAHPYLDNSGRRQAPVLKGTEPVDSYEYLTDAFAREATAYIEKNRNKPFFVYLPFNAVHSPLQSIEKYLTRYSSIADEKRRVFAAMMAAMDDGIGRVLGKIREHKLEEDTLIFFISDNGGPTPQTSSMNDPLRGYKAQLLEGGIRVPFMVQWKGRIPAGKVYTNNVISLDICPTLYAAAGGNITKEMKFDGVNLMPYIMGESKGTPHDRLCWRIGEQWAIRSGDWKLVQTRGAWKELYNLKEDVHEDMDLSTKKPEKVKQLRAEWEEWNKQNVDALWRREGGMQRRQGNRALQMPGGGRRRGGVF